MKIAISGLSGCGNTTACTNVGKALGLNVINYTLRNASQECGFSLQEMQLLAGKFDVVDCMLDKKLSEIVEREGNCVVGTRLAGWLIDADLSVWLHASLRTRAQRIGQREEKPLRQLMKETAIRDKQNIDRYKKIYGINTLNHHQHFDLVVNTERLSPEQVAGLIVAAAELGRGWQRPVNPFPQRIKAIIDRKLTPENLNSIKDENVKKVISCLQFK